MWSEAGKQEDDGRERDASGWEKGDRPLRDVERGEMNHMACAVGTQRVWTCGVCVCLGSQLESQTWDRLCGILSPQENDVGCSMAALL